MSLALVNMMTFKIYFILLQAFFHITEKCLDFKNAFFSRFLEKFYVCVLTVMRIISDFK